VPKAGGPQRRGRLPTRTREQVLRALDAAGWDPTKVGAILGVSRQRVGQIVAALKIDLTRVPKHADLAESQPGAGNATPVRKGRPR
jgi:hypothetical protein